jgi:anti-anti-sigma factor
VIIKFDKVEGLDVLAVKGKIHLQNWRVLDKHLETLKAKGCRRLIMDLSSVTLICSTGIATLLQNLKRFQEDGGEGLMLVCTDKTMQEILATFGCRFFPSRHHPGHANPVRIHRAHRRAQCRQIDADQCARRQQGRDRIPQGADDACAAARHRDR